MLCTPQMHGEFNNYFAPSLSVHNLVNKHLALFRFIIHTKFESARTGTGVGYENLTAV